MQAAGDPEEPRLRHRLPPYPHGRAPSRRDKSRRAQVSHRVEPQLAAAAADEWCRKLLNVW